MRKILFRGKEPNSKKWRYGYVETFCNEYVVVDEEHKVYCVKQETVSQYTGLTDKNGRKIFEGDVVKVTDDYGEIDFCDGGIGDVCFYDGMWYVAGQVQNGLFDLSKLYYIEVIGNRWDNSKLLGGRMDE